MEKVCTITSNKKTGAMFSNIYGDVLCSGQKVIFFIWYKDELVVNSEHAEFSYVSLITLMKLVEKKVFTCIMDLDENNKPIIKEGMVSIAEVTVHWTTEEVEKMLSTYGLDLTRAILKRNPLPYYKDYIKKHL